LRLFLLQRKSSSPESKKNGPALVTASIYRQLRINILADAGRIVDPLSLKPFEVKVARLRG
jgi:hypothetical protein